METPNVPVRAEISGASGTGAMDMICASVCSEGGYNETGIIRSIGCVTALNANVVGVEYVAVMLRYKSESASQVTITNFSISSMGTTGDKYAIILRLIRDTTKITNYGTQTWTSISDSALEAARPSGNPGDAVITADNLSSASGTLLHVSYAIGNNTSPTISLNNSLTPGWSLAGVSDIISVSIIPFGANLDVYASIVWREIQ